MNSKQVVHLARQNRESKLKDHIMFIIANNSIIAKIDADAKANAGESVKFSRQRCEEAINAGREWNLVNASYGKISDAAKWHKAWGRMCGEEQCEHGSAVEINPGEYFIS